MKNITQREFDKIIKKHDLWYHNKRGGARADLSEMDLRRFNLENINLSGAILQKVNMSEMDLRHTNLLGANLNGADLSNSNLSGCKLYSEDSIVNYMFCKCITSLVTTNLRGSNLSSANLEYTDMRDSDLGNAVLKFARLRGTRLYRAHLSNVDLSNADLSFADLGGARLVNVNITNTKLYCANIASSFWGDRIIVSLKPNAVTGFMIYNVSEDCIHWNCGRFIGTLDMFEQHIRCELWRNLNETDREEFEAIIAYFDSFRRIYKSKIKAVKSVKIIKTIKIGKHQ